MLNTSNYQMFQICITGRYGKLRINENELMDILRDAFPDQYKVYLMGQRGRLKE